MLKSFGTLHVFSGPSTSHLPKGLLSRIRLHSPVARGDLQNLLSEWQPKRVLILDGLFGARLAVTPTEIRQALEAGCQIYGAASMGAIRACELWPLGMIGLGDVYSRYRTGHLTSDADVAVLYSEGDYRELTLAMVHIERLLQAMCIADRIDVVQARKMHRAARAIYWPERNLSALERSWIAQGIAKEVAGCFRDFSIRPELHPKKRDALYAISALTQSVWLGLPELIRHDDKV